VCQKERHAEAILDCSQCRVATRRASPVSYGEPILGQGLRVQQRRERLSAPRESRRRVRCGRGSGANVGVEAGEGGVRGRGCCCSFHV
jgi:hypothetical protein